MDHFLPQLTSRSLPADADPYHRQILQLILDDYTSGRLREYCSDLAIDSAVESYKNLQKEWKKISADLQKDTDGTRDLSGLLYDIKDIRKLVAGVSGTRRKVFSTRTGTDQSGLEAFHQEIALTVSREMIKKGEVAPKLVSGHSTDTCYQYALDELDAAGVNMNDSAVYTALGMDRKVFWDNYKQQVDWMNTTANKPQKVYSPRF